VEEKNYKQQMVGTTLPFIVRAFKTSGLSQVQLAKKLEKSEGWVSKLFSGKQKSVDGATYKKLENILKIDSFNLEKNGNVSPLAGQIATMVDADPLFAKLAICAKDAITEARSTFDSRYVPTEEMSDLGIKILAITKANPDKPGKVAKLVVNLLAH
jgi:transcriptional regulator with XRE-family HTH domain